jgi:alpha-1,3-mannosyltransferase
MGWEAILHRRMSSQAFFAIALLWLVGEAYKSVDAIREGSTFIFDWDAYMEQASQVVHGERNYSAIRGDTGPLVYPAVHVAIHAGLLRATGWDAQNWTTEFEHSRHTKPEASQHRTHRPEGTILQLQFLYLGLYMAFLAVNVGLYRLADAGILWALPLWFGVRGRNVFVVGLFNDCWAMLFAYSAVFLAALEHWDAATVLFSLGLGTKMNVLLFLPAYMMLVYYRGGWRQFVRQGLIGAAVQLAFGLPFLVAAPLDYLSTAFDFGRQFTQRWSINWKHLPSEVFDSKWFGLLLLVGHLAMLGVLTARFWLPQLQRLQSVGREKRAEIIVRMLVLCNFVGVVFARSLHYQFHIWYWYSLPIVLASGKLPWWVSLAVLLFLEKAWNVHESTADSASRISFGHVLALAGHII